MNNDEIIEHAKTVAAHWIIEDKGFAGVVYRCSNCGESWNDYYCKFPKDFCAWCGKDIDEDANEYVEEIKYIEKTDGYFTKEEAKAYSQELLCYSTPTGHNVWEDFCENDRDDITDIPVYDLTTKSFVSGE